MHRFIMMLHLLGNVEQMGKDQLGHGVGAVGGNVADQDTALTSGFGIDYIVTRGHHADVLQLG